MLGSAVDAPNAMLDGIVYVSMAAPAPRLPSLCPPHHPPHWPGDAGPHHHTLHPTPAPRARPSSHYIRSHVCWLSSTSSTSSAAPRRPPPCTAASHTATPAANTYSRYTRSPRTPLSTPCRPSRSSAAHSGSRSPPCVVGDGDGAAGAATSTARAAAA